MPRVVRDDRDRPNRSRRDNCSQQLAHRFGVDYRRVGHGDQPPGYRIPGPSTLNRRRSDAARTKIHERPQAGQEGPEDEMDRIDEEHMAPAGDRGLRTGLQFGLEEIGLGSGVLGQVLLGGPGTGQTRWNFRPMSLRNLRTWLVPRRNPVRWRIRSRASAMVRAGRSSMHFRLTSGQAAISLTR